MRGRGSVQLVVPQLGCLDTLLGQTLASVFQVLQRYPAESTIIIIIELD